MGPEYVEGLGKYVVVDETSVNGKTAHQKDYIAPTKKDLKDFRILNLFLQASFLKVYVYT